jgi:cyclic beta-1,2-glucan synthetase
VTVAHRAGADRPPEPATRLARDPRLRHIAITAAAGALLLAVTAALLAALHEPVGLTIAAVVLAVPVAAVVSGAIVVFRLWMGAARIPAPPRLSRAAATPALAATVVAYPVIVHGDADVETLLDCVRESRLAAGDGFAMHLVLVDFADTDTPTGQDDAILRAAIEAGVAALNGPDDRPAIAALFRHRRWNPREGVYMGWERKRGKLEELTDLVAGQPGTSFDLDAAEPRDIAARLRGIRYVLTLDVGDRLLPDGAWRLVATIAHPDNAAVVDPATGIVERGYGFVRPTMVPAPPTTTFEWALRPYPIPAGALPLSQTFFGQDAFLGKGVIDVAVYRAVLAGRIPSDRVLSHDTLEGMHGRVAAIADARVVEANVGDYLVFRSREHRWIRGDAHLMPWIVTAGRRDMRRLAAADRGQMAANILGHLYHVAILGLLALGWLAAPAGQVGWWTATVLAVLAHPIVIMPSVPLLAAMRIYAAMRRRPGRDRRWRRQLLLILVRKSSRPAARAAAAEAGQLMVWLPLLVDRAVIAVDALGRAGYRMTISRRHVLRWTSSAQAGRISPGFTTRLRHLWPSCVVTLLLGGGIAAAGPDRLAWAAPLLAAWLAAPAFAQWTARPR